MRQDHESIEALLAHGAEVDLPNVFQMTPLMVAVGMSGTNRGGGPETNDQDKVIRTVDLLLAAGADVNARVLNSRTHTAVLQSYIQGRDQEGRTALFAAAEGARDKVVAHLLAKGADPAVKDAAGKTVLDAAKTPGLAPGFGGAGRGAPGPKERAETVRLLEARLAGTAAPVAATTTSK
jgi:ankyrin repeat protein